LSAENKSRQAIGVTDHPYMPCLTAIPKFWASHCLLALPYKALPTFQTIFKTPAEKSATYFGIFFLSHSFFGELHALEDNSSRNIP
jgi:hypothetical protein